MLLSHMGQHRHDRYHAIILEFKRFRISGQIPSLFWSKIFAEMDKSIVRTRVDVCFA